MVLGSNSGHTGWKRLHRHRILPGLRWVHGAWRALPPSLPPFLLCLVTAWVQTASLGRAGQEEAEVSDKAAPSVGSFPPRPAWGGVRTRKELGRTGESHLSWLKSSSASPWCLWHIAHISERWWDSLPFTAHVHNAGKEKPSSIYQNICIIYKNWTLMSWCYWRQQYLTMLAAQSPAIPQTEHGTEWHVGRLICKASRTWTLWNVAVGWRILETSPGIPGLCTWNSSGGGPGHQTEPWSASYPKKNISFVTGPKYLNIPTFCQWNYNAPVWAVGW